MKITILGTGTSTGVPVPGCDCSVCRSTNPKNRRLRTSAHLLLEDEGKEAFGILIDSGPDLRLQALERNLRRINAVLFTHAHADHIFGIDDLRSFNFLNHAPIPVFASRRTGKELLAKFEYCFTTDNSYEGGAPPRLLLNVLEPYQEFSLAGQTILPLVVYHGKMEVFGFRFGPFAYITDCSDIPERTRELLQGVEVLVLDGLRERPHKTHLTLRQAVTEVEKIRPRQTFLTHVSHELDHETANEKLQSMTDFDVSLAYDGLELSFSNK